MKERRDFLKKVGVGAGAIGALFASKAAANAEEVVREAVEGAASIDVKVEPNKPVDGKSLAKELKQELRKHSSPMKAYVKDGAGNTLELELGKGDIPYHVPEPARAEILRLGHGHSFWCREAGVPEGHLFSHRYAETSTTETMRNLTGSYRYKEWRGARFNGANPGTLPTTVCSDPNSTKGKRIIEEANKTYQDGSEGFYCYGPVFEVRRMDDGKVFELWLTSKSLRKVSTSMDCSGNWTTEPCLIQGHKVVSSKGYSYWTLSVNERSNSNHMLSSDTLAGTLQAIMWDRLRDLGLQKDSEIYQQGDRVNVWRPREFARISDMWEESDIIADTYAVGRYHYRTTLRDREVSKSWAYLMRTHFEPIANGLADVIKRDGCVGIVNQAAVSQSLGMRDSVNNYVRVVMRYNVQKSTTDIDVMVNAYGPNVPVQDDTQEATPNVGPLDLSKVSDYDYNEFINSPLGRRMLRLT